VDRRTNTSARHLKSARLARQARRSDQTRPRAVDDAAGISPKRAILTRDDHDLRRLRWPRSVASTSIGELLSAGVMRSLAGADLFNRHLEHTEIPSGTAVADGTRALLPR